MKVFTEHLQILLAGCADFGQSAGVSCRPTSKYSRPFVRGSFAGAGALPYIAGVSCRFHS